MFANFNYSCSNVLDLRNLQEQVKKVFCFKHSSDLSFQFQKVFSLTRTFFSQLRSEQFWKQYTNVELVHKISLNNYNCFFLDDNFWYDKNTNFCLHGHFFSNHTGWNCNRDWSGSFSSQ